MLKSFILLFSFCFFLPSYSQDSYDPFVDYSEFEEPEKEKEDIQFFRNGRFVTLGFIVGYNTLTEKMGEYAAPGTSFGLYLGYFFDLRFSMQLSYWSSDHATSLKTNQGNQKELSTSFDEVGVHLKYHLNTQTLAKGLALLNPYLIIGLGRMTRTFVSPTIPELGKLSAISADAGLGLEIPMMRGKMYLGLQAMYHFAQFEDETVNQTVENESNSGIFFNGDLISAMLHIGINF